MAPKKPNRGNTCVCGHPRNAHVHQGKGVVRCEECARRSKSVLHQCSNFELSPSSKDRYG